MAIGGVVYRDTDVDGDIYPITVGGRIFTFFVLMVGLGIVVAPTGLVTSALSQARAGDDSVWVLTCDFSVRGVGVLCGSVLSLV